MVDRASSAMAPDERNASFACRAQVDLLPWVLVPAYEDAWVVAVEEQEWLLWTFVTEEPDAAQLGEC